MHLEILVEDKSGKKMLEKMVPMIIGEDHSYRIVSYKGLGRIPKNMKSGTDANKRILLDRLPKILSGYGKTYNKQAHSMEVAVIVVCDLDDRCQKKFREELYEMRNSIFLKLETLFCFAIEEGEAWLLGDIKAGKQPFRT